MKNDWLKWPETKKLIAAFGKDELRFVGGCVRDALLDKQVVDIDAATPLAPDTVAKRLEKAGIRAIPTGIDHGTVTALIDKKPFEITTLRRDVETYGRHAKVEYTDDWKADAARRDFTMNALYLSPEGELFDYFGGVEDAKAGRVKFIGDADARVTEDYLRILRFFRFYAHYGKGEPDAQALKACAAHAKKLSSISGERIQQEMMKLLAAPAPENTLYLMQKTGVLPELFGVEISLDTLAQLQIIEKNLGEKPDALLRLAALLPSEKTLHHIDERWKLSGDMRRSLQTFFSHRRDLSATSPLAAQKKYLRQLGASFFRPIVLLCWAQHPDENDAFKAMLALAEKWTPPIFPVTGDDLIALGMAPGKTLGDRLRALEEQWEESDYKLTKGELLSSFPEFGQQAKL